jgi:hypothetical protein
MPAIAPVERSYKVLARPIPGECPPFAPDSCNEVSPVTSSATPEAPAQPTWPRDFDIRARYAEQQELLQPAPPPQPSPAHP